MTEDTGEFKATEISTPAEQYKVNDYGEIESPITIDRKQELRGIISSTLEDKKTDPEAPIYKNDWEGKPSYTPGGARHFYESKPVFEALDEISQSDPFGFYHFLETVDTSKLDVQAVLKLTRSVLKDHGIELRMVSPKKSIWDKELTRAAKDSFQSGSAANFSSPGASLLESHEANIQHVPNKKKGVIYVNEDFSVDSDLLLIFIGHELGHAEEIMNPSGKKQYVNGQELPSDCAPATERTAALRAIQTAEVLWARKQENTIQRMAIAQAALYNEVMFGKIIPEYVKV